MSTLDATLVQHCENASAVPLTAAVHFGTAYGTNPTKTQLTAPRLGRSTLPLKLSAHAISTTRATPKPTGTVTFTDGTTVLGVVALDRNAKAHLTVQLSPGVHTITAHYSGDVNDARSSSVSRITTIR